MPVGLRIQCDADGCERHYNVPADMVDDVIDLSAFDAAMISYEALIGLPKGWHVRGTRTGLDAAKRPFEVRCPEHAPT